MADTKSIQKKLQALTYKFADSLPSKLDAIESIWKQLRVSHHLDDINNLVFYCHRLAGSGASFGFKSVSDYSRSIENELKDILYKSKEADSPIWPEDANSKIAALIDQLMSQKAAQPDVAFQQQPVQKPSKKHTVTEDDHFLVYIHEKNRLIADELTTKLKTYNYSVRNFSQLQELLDACNDVTPDVVVIDNTIFNAQAKLLIAELKNKFDFSIIHLANSGNFNDRLEAVRVGVDYYFTKPLDYSSIIDTLDKLADQDTVTSSKVLIADDSESTSQFYALSLKREGIETKVVTDPFRVMDEVIEFKPELILLDLNMPKCSGLELAAVIRQQENYISIPIIFLSGEMDKQKQIETLEMGADEFLNKPVNINHLIAIVKNKIIRYRLLSAYMHNDSLTGLLNHTSILSVLDTEISRADREQANLSYAMIDIDFFKSINDSYGHHMGDMVIKSISRFIKQNLRVTDSVGRYGGEEFVAILPGIDATVAAHVIQKILDKFSKLDFVHYNHKFNVTFSCGIADYDSNHSSNEMIDAADKALYIAKKEGRNCIRVATS